MLTLNDCTPILIAICTAGLLSLSSCTTKGCTDPFASNFSYEANKDDGSCDYGGCTNPDALNYNPDAQYDNGTCSYNGDVRIVTSRSNVGNGNVALIVHINGEYIGKLQSNCTSQYPTCTSGCANLPFLDKSDGSYLLRFWEIRPTSSTTADTIFESSPKNMQVIGAECNIYVIE
jgi:hypothetical protein